MTGRFVAPSGHEIYFEDVGEGQPLLAIHGVGGGAYFFRGLAARLGSSCRVVAVDLPATGRSVSRDTSAVLDVPSLSMESWVSDLRAFVDLHLKAPVVLVGHSMGTIVALKAWEAWPASIAGLVFVGGLPEVRAEARQRMEQRLVTVASQGLAELGPQISPANFSATSFRTIPEVIGLFERAFEQQVPAVYRRSVEILLEHSAAAIVPTVTVPVCSISGAEDQYAPPDAVRAFLARLPSPAHEVVLPEVGHLPFFEAPEAFASALDRFLQRLPAAPGH